MSWTLLIHGGAGAMSRERATAETDRAARDGLAAALRASGDLLAAGGSALDAVEAAVRSLEDDPQFNAGRGAVFTATGTHELDAAIMDGKTRCAGAVAGVTRTRNPVALARAVMEKSKHVMLVGAGADDFSREQGLAQVEPDYFSTPERRAQLERMRGRFDGGVKFGTVGAVARDRSGHLAAATSTGGLTGKRPGRVGDTPVIGAGTYADDRGCAVSATGSGEYYVRIGVAHEICARVRFLGESAQAAADAVQAETHALGGDGGVIVVMPDGSHAWSFSTPGMYRGMLAAGAEPQVAIYRDED
jgi:L-asparaginase / beta-aspartyl-peptidase